MGEYRKQVNELEKIASKSVSEDASLFGKFIWKEIGIARKVVTEINNTKYSVLASENAYLLGVIHGKRIERMKQKNKDDISQTIADLEAENKRLKSENNYALTKLKKLENDLINIECSFYDWERTLLNFDSWMGNVYKDGDVDRALRLMSDWDFQSPLFRLFFDNFREKNKLLSETTAQLEKFNYVRKKKS
ncbi:hypothetical protein ACOJIU_12710 [Carnobacterium maltaromaticum]|uniref:hypothetical protein n=1 Tax=Carnobacterium maltaromaticum TaxID=2751 RepID=UPI003B980D84